ncbi:MAG: hypothetical protein WKG07_12920 [Hymenobacter sp.]
MLLIGAGLAAVDMLLALRTQGHRAPVHVVARRGRWPAGSRPGRYAGSPQRLHPELTTETTVAGTLPPGASPGGAGCRAGFRLAHRH